jgi:Carboxypeptidase regulatory-like domain
MATACLFTALTMLWAPAAFSQTMTTGDIVGTVADATGAVVPKATVTIRLTSENTARTAVTDNTGHYRFSLMPPGDYELEAGATGLKSKIERFTLLIGQETNINLTLSVQGTQQTVEVQAQAAILQTENANLASGFNTAQVQNLPMNGGDITTIAFTVPGILVLPGGGAAGNFNVNGIPGASTLFTLNGADDMDPYLNINTSGPSNNTLGSNEIGEAAVVLNAYSGDYGRMAGAQVNYVGKTGSNSFHGNLFYNYNDALFNANDFFNNASGTPRGRADANQFGGSVGGPIKKNKLFFFFNYESLRYVLPSSGNYEVPSPQLEQYALAHVSAAAVPLYQSAISLWNNAPGINRAVPVTTGAGPLQDSSGNLGCGNYGELKGLAAPGGGTFGVNVPCALAFGTNVSQSNKESLQTDRIDWNISDKQKINFRYNYDWGLQATAASPLNPAFNSVSNQPSDQGQLNYTYVISPNLVNNFVGSGSWYTAIFGVANFAATSKLQPEIIGITDSSMNSGGWATAGAGFPDGRNVGQAQFVDDLTWIHGKHTFKGGLNYRFDKVTDTSIASGAEIGNYSFADLADFANGTINLNAHGGSFSQSFPDIFAAHIRLYSLGGYVQDEWKARQNLTLTMAFRFERDGNPSCVDDCFALMNTQFGTSGYVGGANVPYNSTITTGLHDAYHSLEAIVPEPRFGFAWSPFGQGKTVIRGGVGLFASLFAGSVSANVFDNAPNKFTPSVTFGTVGLPTNAGSSANSALAAYNTFTTGFSQGYTLSQIQTALGSKIPFGLPNYYSPPNDFVAPKALEWSLEIEHPLTAHNILAATYTGNHGYDESLTNSFANSYLTSAGMSKYFPGGFGGLPTLTAPDPRFLTVSQIQTAGISNYDALTVQLRHAFSHGFQAQVGYTWSHDLGSVSISNPYNIGFAYAPLSIDVRNAVVSDLIWQEPKLANKLLDRVAGGWNFSWKFYAYTGRPFSITDSKLPAEINSGGGLGTILASAVNSGGFPSECQHVAGSPGSPCYTASEFQTYASNSGVATPVQMGFGETSPDSFRGPGYFDIDTQVTKKIFIRERMNFEFGGQLYNLLNHPNFRNPAANVGSPSSLGVISSDYSPPTSIYGSGQGAAVSGRVIVVTGKFTF